MKTRQAVWMQPDTRHVGDAPEGWQYHVVGWNQVPEGIDLGSIERVILADHGYGDHPATPTMLRRFPNVRSVSTDTHLLALTPADLPLLEELHIVGTSAVDAPRGPWPRLRVLEARDAQVNIVDAAEFPVLEDLEIRSKATKKAFSEIGKLAKLRELKIGPMKDDAALAHFEALPLEVLAFNRGSIASLSGVTRFQKLKGFGAMNCHAFADLAPLAKLPSLEEVWFNSCAGIKKPGALLDLPKLRRVMFWGCRDDGGALKKVSRKLMDQGVTVDTELFE